MTSQEQEFNRQIDEIGDCYENIKDALNAAAFGFLTEQLSRDAFGSLYKLRDIACMKTKEIHQPISN